MTLAERALEVHQRLVEHYGFPEWRNPLPALDELVSTILSQNTNDVNRDRAFEVIRHFTNNPELIHRTAVQIYESTTRPEQKADMIRAISGESGRLGSTRAILSWSTFACTSYARRISCRALGFSICCARARVWACSSWSCWWRD